MTEIPELVKLEWEQRNGPAVFTTVSTEGKPNSVYVACMALHGSASILIADNYFSKTRENILAGSPASFLFITENSKACQIKGSLQYRKEGEYFDEMKKWNPEKHPGHAVVVLDVEEVYSGAEQLA